MKIYITGPVGGGKTTLARRLAADYGIPAFEADGFRYETDLSNPNYNHARSDDDCESLLAAALVNKAWVMEDAGRAMFEEAWRQADTFVLLVPPLTVRLARIMSRWVKQNLGLEACSYQPHLKMIFVLLRWTRDYENGRDGLRTRLTPYAGKLVVLRSKRDVERFVIEIELFRHRDVSAS